MVLLLSFMASMSFAAECKYMTKLECNFFHSANNKRLKRKIPALRSNANCVKAARAYARELYEDWRCPPQKTRHYSKRYGKFSKRMNHFGVAGSRAENLYCAPGRSVATVLSGFMNSRGHRKNIMNKAYRSTGVAQYKGRWVQCFSTASN